MAIVLNGTSGITNDSGYTGDGVSFADSTPANTLVTTSDGNVGIGTSSPAQKLEVNGILRIDGSAYSEISNNGSAGREILQLRAKTTVTDGAGINLYGAADSLEPNAILFFTDGSSSRGRFTSGGDFLVGTTEDTPGLGNNTVGISATSNGQFFVSAAPVAAWFNVTSDGTIVSLRSGGTSEGTISVSGTTVSYNGGHLSRWAQTTTAKDESLVKGTVLSNLDEMNVYTDAEGNPVQNEQLNKVKVSDVEGDANVAGVFVNWEHDEAHNVDEINMAMTGDMIIRIAQGVTVARGDLLMSAGDGTAKPQGDDIVRSKTIAKVTSTHVTCTYADGSFCVPCVLMAC
jgi:hypothetical protein